MLRALGHISAAARQLVYGWSGATKDVTGLLRSFDEGHGGLPEHWRLLRRLLAEMKRVAADSGAQLAVSVLPYRADLEAQDPETTPTYAARGKVVELATELGLDAFDAWPLFQAVVSPGDSGDWFNDEIPGDVHFSPKGHARYAEWLTSQLDGHFGGDR